MSTAAQRQEFLDQSKAHYEADMLIKGTYGDDDGDWFKGCSVGCHLKHIKPDFNGEDHDYGDKHGIVARHYGYPEWLALLQDTIFEGLPNGESAKWHVQLAETLHGLPDDHDWQAALHRVHIAILRISYRTAGAAQGAVQAVIDLHERAINGDLPADDEWSAAESAARSAARSAAWSAAKSAAESAARSAAESAAWSAAESAAWSAAESAAESAAFQEMRDAILMALRCPQEPAQ